MTPTQTDKEGEDRAALVALAEQNVRFQARITQLEAALKAADRVAELLSLYLGSGVGYVDDALSDYRALRNQEAEKQR